MEFSLLKIVKNSKYFLTRIMPFYVGNLLFNFILINIVTNNLFKNIFQN
ncbi:hypothetical protein SAMN05444408_10184 [Chryseobacterium takakiae]|uniref:Uncharacterized protein n=1 Tax=Chryseobacterium takakiae TaxID=1302685 RepID=A0A1M4SWX2_9FLAO|nr:hypothetical protein SAMN05444408_10184 [Chryseobacterium takakiae]